VGLWWGGLAASRFFGRGGWGRGVGGAAGGLGLLRVRRGRLLLAGGLGLGAGGFCRGGVSFSLLGGVGGGKGCGLSCVVLVGRVVGV